MNGNSSGTDSFSSRPIQLSKINSRENKPWGDVLEEKDPNHTRIYVINLNGIVLDRLGGQFDVVCKILKETTVDIFCGQEHNLDTTQHRLRSILFATADQHWARNKLAIGTSPITFHSAYKPGGTLALTVNSLTGRISKQIRDKWGRWVCQEFQGRAGRKVVVISAYQPLDQSPSTGKITIVSQQQSLLLKENSNPGHTPRSAFRKDLEVCLRHYHAKDVAILLVGDFNEPLGSDPDGMSKIAGTFGLLDVMASRHSSPPPATFARGSRRLDYALASPCISAALKKPAMKRSIVV